MNDKIGRREYLRLALDLGYTGLLVAGCVLAILNVFGVIS